MCSCGCGQVLGECDHVGCPDSPVQLAELRTAINAGMTDQQILDSFAAKYSATVLAAPRTHGFDLVAWIAPFAIFLLPCWAQSCWYATGPWARRKLRKRPARRKWMQFTNEFVARPAVKEGIEQ